MRYSGDDMVALATIVTARRLDRFSQFAMVAAGEAIADAGWVAGEGGIPKIPCLFPC